ncbi:hypothetical protein SAMN04487886_12413 [Clostridium sp. DSM 8431]|uniref:hypothetical protein n=1 Tax=Clostridium sp. DSM 8431 TaxID=1761781 RepID=UPI0008E9B0E8|nr:hypothetical protein [Clostridium sp. DSM 8431]SFU86727.1 hypothetical protein SAMN04487886_12413 [Clostridium sp. DSM 8431]
MKSVLLGNGINIQFGGKAYTSDFILKRIKFKAKLGFYDDLFQHTITGNELLNIFNGLSNIANDIIKGDCNIYEADTETIDAMNDFKKRYPQKINKLHEIMLEDWFFLLHIFFLQNYDLKSIANTAKQGFERIILDSIFNSGKVQDIYHNINKNVKKFMCNFDNIFTLNYDNNIEKLTKKNVYHLHGDFSELMNSENPKNVLGFIREMNNARVITPGMEHCFCTALLNYSGNKKYVTAKNNHKLIIESKKYLLDSKSNSNFMNTLKTFKQTNLDFYNFITTYINNPNLMPATEYYFDLFENIEDELSIIGLSPNNDNHIFNCILKNPKIKKVYFYYLSNEDKDFIEKKYDKSIFECKSVTELWNTLKCNNKQYNIKLSTPRDIDKFITAFNTLSDDVTSKDRILNEAKSIPQFEVARLCKLVKADMLKNKGFDTPKNEDELLKSFHSISYIALQEGILPSTLYLLCIMNYSLLK